MNLSLALRLSRISNLPTVWTNVGVGALLAGGSLADPRLPLLMLALSLFYTGGMFLNDAFDREFDAQHRPERPIPSGQVSARQVFSFGFGMLALGMAVVVGLARASDGLSAWQAPALHPAAHSSMKPFLRATNSTVAHLAQTFCSNLGNCSRLFAVTCK